jgi:hypothetical protein
MVVLVLIFDTSSTAEVDSSATHAKLTGHTSKDVLASSGNLKKRMGCPRCRSGGMVIAIPGSNMMNVCKQVASMVS